MDPRHKATTLTAMTGSAMMVAHQVAGKAVRDSFFLSNYPISALPTMVFAAAVVTLILVLFWARAMSRVGPQRLVPAGFLFSSILHVTEYRAIAQDPALWSVWIYFHIVAMGAILLSSFWSVMAESFDPRAAKQAFGRIGNAGIVGGIVGGLLAERLASMSSANSVLLLLAALHLVCSGVLISLPHKRFAHGAAKRERAASTIPLFRRAPYLWMIAILVLAGATSAAILDYLFKAGVGSTIEKGAPLLRFFAIFYTSTQILTVLAQTFLARQSLHKLGIGRTIASLPLGVGAGALVALVAPIFPVLTLFRSVESSLRGSFFRTGYELLYTPVPEAEKRAAKTLIDVACDRAGDALGCGIVQLMLWLGASFIPSSLLGVMLVLAAVSAWVASRLDLAYSGLMKERLIDRAVELDLDLIQDSTTRSAVSELAVISAPPATPVVPVKAQETDSLVARLKELRSGDSRRIKAALQRLDGLNVMIAGQLLLLLAWDEVSDDVRSVLESNADSITGLLVDHLLNQEDVEFGIRRRIPRILAKSDSQLAVHGLLAGLADLRFEVRFQCSRALDSLLRRRPHLSVPVDSVYAAVERELRVARPIRDSRRLLDSRDSSEPDAFLDEILRERADQTLEHIFSLFASVLPREAVKIAFRSLHSDDPALRGLAIEYLDSVLPDQVRRGLWASIETHPAPHSADAGLDPLEELLRAHESLVVQIKIGASANRQTG